MESMFQAGVRRLAYSAGLTSSVLSGAPKNRSCHWPLSSSHGQRKDWFKFSIWINLESPPANRLSVKH